jgi:capsular exopolysaccharide synthesis family protein
MSKIFDALRKTDLLESADLPEQLFLSRAGKPEAVQMPEPSDPAIAVTLAASPTETPQSVRTATLKISVVDPIFPLDDAQPGAAEQYRIIRTKILQHPLRPRVIVVSSPTSGDGKTITAINLAACLALNQSTSVLLIDGDLRRPMISNLLGIPAAPGLADVLAGRSNIAAAVIQADNLSNLKVLVAGEKKENPAELLDSLRFGALIEQLRRHYSFIIVDATPIGTVADYALVQSACDGVIMVVRQDHTGRAPMKEALRLVPKEKLLGVALNCVEDWFLWKTHGYGYYGGKK